MNLEQLLSKTRQDMITENDAHILELARTKDSHLIERIENFRRDKMTEEERAKITVDNFIESIQSNTIIRATFRKDPTKQNIYEKAQIKCIQGKYPDAYKMNADIGGLCISDYDMFQVSKKIPRPTSATKTFDVSIPSQKIYGVLKYTSEPGGAQDNQYADVKHFIVQIVGYLTKHVDAEEVFVFYLDGKYYTPKKKDELNKMIPENMSLRIIITSCAELFVPGGDGSVPDASVPVDASSTEPDVLVPASPDASVDKSSVADALPTVADALVDKSLPTPDNVQNDTIR
jgi:hypothetical protein